MNWETMGFYRGCVCVCVCVCLPGAARHHQSKHLCTQQTSTTLDNNNNGFQVCFKHTPVIEAMRLSRTDDRMDNSRKMSLKL
jgi:hypothetical protein